MTDLLNYKKNIFNLFLKHSNDLFTLQEEVLKYILKLEYEIKGIENAYFYDILSKLSNSINNAGHEERRSKDISFLLETQDKISSEFEGFLP